MPGVCVHVAYLRKPLQYLVQSNSGAGANQDVLIGGSKSKDDRVDDFLHFEVLCSELAGDGVDYPVAMDQSSVEDDLQVNLQVSRDFLSQREGKAGEGGSDEGGALEGEGAGNGAGTGGKAAGGEEKPRATEDEQKQGVAEKVPMRIRYQQFTEFTSYTFELPVLDDALSTKAGFDEGEALIESLKCLDWWDDIPGELFLVAIVSSRPTKAEGDAIAYDPLAIHNDLHHVQSDSFYPGNAPTGAIVGEQDREMGIFVNYALQVRCIAKRKSKSHRSENAWKEFIGKRSAETND